jgi:hypothetical protein
MFSDNSPITLAKERNGGWAVLINGQPLIDGLITSGYIQSLKLAFKMTKVKLFKMRVLCDDSWNDVSRKEKQMFTSDEVEEYLDAFVKPFVPEQPPNA